MLKAYNCTTLYSTCTTQMSVVQTWKVQAKKTYPHPQGSHIIVIIIIIIIINILIAVPVIAHHDIVVLPVLWPFTFWPSSGFLDQMWRHSGLQSVRSAGLAMLVSHGIAALIYDPSSGVSTWSVMVFSFWVLEDLGVILEGSWGGLGGISGDLAGAFGWNLQDFGRTFAF